MRKWWVDGFGAGAMPMRSRKYRTDFGPSIQGIWAVGVGYSVHRT